MSAPTPAPGEDGPGEGFHPDPSIPGYVRYWNGTAWVPGTSRPAPETGERLAPPSPAGLFVEETGPHFFDEDPVDGPVPAPRHGDAVGPGTHRGAEEGRSGDRPPPLADPRVPHLPAPSRPVWPEAGSAREHDARGVAPTDRAAPGAGDPRQADLPAPAGAWPAAPEPARGPAGGHRASAPSYTEEPGEGAFPPRRQSAETDRPGGSADAPPPPRPAPGTPPAAAGAGPGGPGFGAGKAAAERAAGSAPPGRAAAAPPGPAVVPPRSAGHPPAEAALGPYPGGEGGGQASWAQQVHRLAGSGDGPVPAGRRPPADDPFQAAARRMAAARPAGLGRRLVARLLDTAVVGVVTALVAVPLGIRALDHLHGKIDAARLSGETVTVWLLDSTTGTYLAIVLAVLLLFGVGYEAVPTARWGRTLGKALLGLEVRDIEGHRNPSLGAAVRRWLVFSVPGLLVFGVAGIVWCLFDRPWHQCWHDKAAHTFVADGR
ncbi:RDD family protein [Streptomyces sp. ZYX-F-203]